MTTWIFTWPFGITVNHQYEGFGNKRRLTGKAFTWREEARLTVRLNPPPPLTPPLIIEILVYPPDDKVRRDLDGLGKQTIDAIFLELGLDDNLAVLRGVVMTAYAPSPHPRILARLLSLKQAIGDDVP